MDSYIKLIIQLGICWIVLIAILGVLRSPHGELCPTDDSAGIYYSSAVLSLGIVGFGF